MFESFYQAYVAGDEDAYTKLYKRYWRPLVFFINRFVHNRSVAEELTQDAFMALIQNADRYQATAEFTTYLYTIARNLAIKYIKRLKPELLEFEPEAKPVRGVESWNHILWRIDRLPDKYREPFKLNHLDELKLEEVSKKLGVPLGTVKTRIHRAKKMLRERLLIDKRCGII